MSPAKSGRRLIDQRNHRRFVRPLCDNDAGGTGIAQGLGNLGRQAKVTNLERLLGDTGVMRTGNVLRGTSFRKMHHGIGGAAL